MEKDISIYETVEEYKNAEKEEKIRMTHDFKTDNIPLVLLFFMFPDRYIQVNEQGYHSKYGYWHLFLCLYVCWLFDLPSRIKQYYIL